MNCKCEGKRLKRQVIGIALAVIIYSETHTYSVYIVCCARGPQLINLDCMWQCQWPDINSSYIATISMTTKFNFAIFCFLSILLMLLFCFHIKLSLTYVFLAQYTLILAMLSKTFDVSFSDEQILTIQWLICHHLMLKTLNFVVGFIMCTWFSYHNSTKLEFDILHIRKLKTMKRYGMKQNKQQFCFQSLNLYRSLIVYMCVCDIL